MRSFLLVASVLLSNLVFANPPRPQLSEAQKVAAELVKSLQNFDNYVLATADYAAKQGKSTEAFDSSADLSNTLSCSLQKKLVRSLGDLHQKDRLSDMLSDLKKTEYLEFVRGSEKAASEDENIGGALTMIDKTWKSLEEAILKLPSPSDIKIGARIEGDLGKAFFDPWCRVAGTIVGYDLTEYEVVLINPKNHNIKKLPGRLEMNPDNGEQYIVTEKLKLGGTVNYVVFVTGKNGVKTEVAHGTCK